MYKIIYVVLRSYLTQGMNENVLEFDKTSEYYKDLIALIRERSPVFSQLIEQQVKKEIAFKIA